MFFKDTVDKTKALHEGVDKQLLVYLSPLSSSVFTPTLLCRESHNQSLHFTANSPSMRQMQCENQVNTLSFSWLLLKLHMAQRSPVQTFRHTDMQCVLQLYLSLIAQQIHVQHCECVLAKTARDRIRHERRHSFDILALVLQLWIRLVIKHKTSSMPKWDMSYL